MKVANLKSFAMALVLITGVSFSSIVLAEEVTLPTVIKPAVLEEGTQRVLTDEQIAEILPWAKDSKVFLTDLLMSIQGLSSQDKVDQLVNGISSVVGESAPKNSELLMRYVLNRGLVINEMLSREMGADEVGTIDAKIRVLTSTVNMAINYYDNDMDRMSKKSSAPLAQFGNDYFKFLTELNKSIFDASAQYAIYRTALEWFQWDLYRDLNNKSFASQIVKINNSLKLYPAKKLTDAQAMAYIRQMKGVAGLIDVQDIITKMKMDEEAEFKRKKEEEVEAIRKKLAEEALRAKKLKAEQDLVNLKNRNDSLVKKYGAVIEATQRFDRPMINGVLFSDKSPAEGVCLALGYQMGASSTSESLTYKGNLAIVDSDGEFTGGELTSENRYRTSKYIKTITCVNKFVSKKSPSVESVKAFNNIANGLFISSQSSENGVCKLLGYEKGLKGSAIPGQKMSKLMPIIEEGGVVRRIDSSSGALHLEGVLCVNKIAEEKSIPLVEVTLPKMDDFYFSKNSSAQGVCKNLGYTNGLEGVDYRTDYNTKAGAVALVDITGKFLNLEGLYKDLYISGVVCIK